jgi:hypothetical protein
LSQCVGKVQNRAWKLKPVFVSVPEELPGGGLPAFPRLGHLQHNRFSWRKKHPVVFFWFCLRTKQLVVFFPVLLEKKSACPFLSGSVEEKKQKAASLLLKLQSMEMSRGGLQ